MFLLIVVLFILWALAPIGNICPGLIKNKNI